MATPVIATVGAASGLLKITDQDGVVYRVPLVSLASATDTSNSNVYRLDVSHARGEIILIYASAAEVTAALNAIDALY